MVNMNSCFKYIINFCITDENTYNMDYDLSDSVDDEEKHYYVRLINLHNIINQKSVCSHGKKCNFMKIHPYVNYIIGDKSRVTGLTKIHKSDRPLKFHLELLGGHLDHCLIGLTKEQTDHFNYSLLKTKYKTNQNPVEIQENNLENDKVPQK